MFQYFDEPLTSPLPLWDISIPDILPRSKLYDLIPLGLNGPFVESLASYVCRLANEHCVQVGALIQCMIAPVIAKQYVANGQSRSISSFLRYAAAINGIGVMASDWVGALESLTLRADLSLLTLLKCSDALSQRDLLQPARQWCPICYDTWRRQGVTLYEPLLWSINGVAVCTMHHLLLEKRCPHCSSHLPWLAWRSRPGYCSSCGGWMGSPKGISQIEEKDLHAAQMIGDLIAHVPRLSLPIPRASFVQTLRDLIAITEQGNTAAFSRRVGLAKTNVWELVQGRFPPSLPLLLRLCYQYRLSLVQLIIGADGIAPDYSSASLEQGRKRVPCRSFDHKKVLQALEEILADQQSAPLSMREVARRLGYYVRTIKTHFPMHCREISRRYTEYRKRQGQIRKADLKQRIREAAHIVRCEGRDPTYRRVGAILRAPGCFREDEARRALHTIRRSLDEELTPLHDVELTDDIVERH